MDPSPQELSPMPKDDPSRASRKRRQNRARQDPDDSDNPIPGPSRRSKPGSDQDDPSIGGDLSRRRPQYPPAAVHLREPFPGAESGRVGQVANVWPKPPAGPVFYQMVEVPVVYQYAPGQYRPLYQFRRSYTAGGLLVGCGGAAVLLQTIGLLIIPNLYCGLFVAMDGYWTAVFYFLAGGIAIAAGSAPSQCLVRCNLVTSTLSAVAAGAGVIVAGYGISAWDSTNCDSNYGGSLATRILMVVVACMALAVSIWTETLSCATEKAPGQKITPAAPISPDREVENTNSPLPAPRPAPQIGPLDINFPGGDE